MHRTIESSTDRSTGAPAEVPSTRSGGRLVQGGRALRRRLQRKLAGLAPVMLGALLLLGCMSTLLYVLEPHLPAAYRQLLDRVQQGDWAGSCGSVIQLFGGDMPWPIFTGAQILQVLFAPIPGQLLGLLGGCLFGFWPGLLLTMLGVTLGSAIAIGGSRVLGAAVVRRFVPAAILSRFDHLTTTSGVWSFFLIFLLPMLPDDAICFMAGLTRLPIHRLLLVSVLGRLPGMAMLALVGAGAGALYANLALAAVTVLAIGVWLWSEEVEGLLAGRS